MALLPVHTAASAIHQTRPSGRQALWIAPALSLHVSAPQHFSSPARAYTVDRLRFAQDYARWHVVPVQPDMPQSMAEPLVRPKDFLDARMLSACSLPLPAAKALAGLQAQLLAQA